MMRTALADEDPFLGGLTAPIFVKDQKN